MEERDGVDFFSGDSSAGRAQEGNSETQKEIKEMPKIFSRVGNSVSFGEWPQTIKSNNVTITGPLDGRGFYMGSDGAYYAKVIAKPYYRGYLFSNNVEIIEGETYYFKVEPLKWTIIKEDGGKLLILCDNIILNKSYQSNYGKDEDGDIVTFFNNAPPNTYANNYDYSEIRAWLSDQFLKTIKKTPGFEASKIDILQYDIHEGSGLSCCDEAFLLSIGEVPNLGEEYKTRMRKATDYAKANGTYVYGAMSGVRSRASGKGWWWLRTPCASEGKDTVHAIDQNGVTNYAWIWVKGYGIVPALYIDVSAYNN